MVVYKYFKIVIMLDNVKWLPFETTFKLKHSYVNIGLNVTQ